MGLGLGLRLGLELGFTQRCCEVVLHIDSGGREAWVGGGGIAHHTSGRHPAGERARQQARAGLGARVLCPRVVGGHGLVRVRVKGER